MTKLRPSVFAPLSQPSSASRCLASPFSACKMPTQESHPSGPRTSRTPLVPGKTILGMISSATYHSRSTNRKAEYSRKMAPPYLPRAKPRNSSYQRKSRRIKISRAATSTLDSMLAQTSAAMASPITSLASLRQLCLGNLCLLI